MPEAKSNFKLELWLEIGCLNPFKVDSWLLNPLFNIFLEKNQISDIPSTIPLSDLKFIVVFEYHNIFPQN